MSDAQIPLTCLRCGQSFSPNLKDLEKVDQVVHRTLDLPTSRQEKYRVVCPVCTQRWIITVEITEEEDDD